MKRNPLLSEICGKMLGNYFSNAKRLRENPTQLKN
jgi:hypothetical protein